jgi:hypothetical protein
LEIAKIPPGVRFLIDELPITVETLSEIASKNNIPNISGKPKNKMLDELAEKLPPPDRALVGYVGNTPDAYNSYAPALSNTAALKLRFRYITQSGRDQTVLGGVVSSFIRPLSERVALDFTYGSQILSAIPDWDSTEDIGPSVAIRRA